MDDQEAVSLSSYFQRLHYVIVLKSSNVLTFFTHGITGSQHTLCKQNLNTELSCLILLQ